LVQKSEKPRIFTSKILKIVPYTRKVTGRRDFSTRSQLVAIKEETKMSTQKLTLSALALALCSMALASNPPTVDGTLDSSYGSSLANQQNVTSFGQSTTGSAYNSSAGSQLDAAYGLISGGTLYIMLTGNLQTNGNHLDIWLDTGAAGQNTLSGTTGAANSHWEGATLSNGFNASQFFTVNGNGTSFYVNQDTLSGSAWVDSYLGSNGYGGTGGGTLSGGANPGNILAAIDDSNSGASINLADTTGMEMAIPLADLGNPTGPIKIIADINGGQDDYLSNQFLGSLTSGMGSLGDDGAGNYTNGSLAAINLSNYGNPMFIVNPQAVPAPMPIAVLGLGVLALIVRKRSA